MRTLLGRKQWFLFSKHVDTMSNVTVCEYSQTNRRPIFSSYKWDQNAMLRYIICNNLVNPSFHRRIFPCNKKRFMRSECWDNFQNLKMRATAFSYAICIEQIFLLQNFQWKLIWIWWTKTETEPNNTVVFVLFLENCRVWIFFCPQIYFSLLDTLRPVCIKL